MNPPPSRRTEATPTPRRSETRPMSTTTEPALDPHAATLATLSRGVRRRGLHDVAVPRQPAPLRARVAADRAADGPEGPMRLRHCSPSWAATDYLGYPGRTRARFEVHYVLRNLETAERLVVKVGRRRPRSDAPLGRPPLAGRRLDGARGLRHVRHPLRRPPRPAADPDARRVHRLPAAQGLPAPRPGRAAQLPAADPRASREPGESRSAVGSSRPSGPLAIPTEKA